MQRVAEPIEHPLLADVRLLRCGVAIVTPYEQAVARSHVFVLSAWCVTPEGAMLAGRACAAGKAACGVATGFCREQSDTEASS